MKLLRLTTRSKIILQIIVVGCFVFKHLHASNTEEQNYSGLYKEIIFPTPNIDETQVNTVQGVILHHTAEPTIKRSLEVLTSSTRRVGTHVVIDTDGTRYIMASPETVTYHAGLSILDGKEGCNYFTIGIEFQGNTLEKPLSRDQIYSAIEYLLPLTIKYKIPLKSIVTHEMVRQEYKKKYPNKKCSGKVDITQKEYLKFMTVFKVFFNIKTLIQRCAYNQ